MERYVYDPYGNPTVYNSDWSATVARADPAYSARGNQTSIPKPSALISITISTYDAFGRAPGRNPVRLGETGTCPRPAPVERETRPEAEGQPLKQLGNVYPELGQRNEEETPMVSRSKGLLRICVLVAGLCACMISAACSNGGKRVIRCSQQNEHLRILLEGEPLQVAGRLQFSGRVEVENVSTRDVLIFDDAGLPTVLHAPPDMADVFWGLSKMPDYALFEVPEAFRTRVLEPTQSHRYEFTLENPLKEHAHYGNPWYEDPGSPLFGRKPAQLLWRTVRVRVAYYALGDSALMHRLSGSRLSEGQMAKIEGTEQVIFKYQREIAATVACPEN